MLGKTAGGLLWMSRYLERSENTARLVETGARIALTRSNAAHDEWASIIDTAGAREAFQARYKAYDAPSVINFLLRDVENPLSVRAMINAARNNARLVRTALTREVWEAVNVFWMSLSAALARPVEEGELPGALNLIRQQSSLVRGAIEGTMLRNDIYNFLRIGTFIERADSTARILDVKYYVLLPTPASVGSHLDNVQWEMILRAASAERAFGWLHGAESSPLQIAQFLIFDARMPRSLIFCYANITDNLSGLAREYKMAAACAGLAQNVMARLEGQSIEAVFDAGLHEFVTAFIRDNAAIGRQIEEDYRFYG